jgi:hypothetical protein
VSLGARRPSGGAAGETERDGAALGEGGAELELALDGMQEGGLGGLGAVDGAEMDLEESAELGAGKQGPQEGDDDGARPEGVELARGCEGGESEGCGGGFEDGARSEGGPRGVEGLDGNGERTREVVGEVGNERGEPASQVGLDEAHGQEVGQSAALLLLVELDVVSVGLTKDVRNQGREVRGGRDRLDLRRPERECQKICVTGPR